MSLRYLRDAADEGNTVAPIPTFVDPVSKIRVSQPQNLIDTDFEYGLQETKWETLERVNNIPTFFARPGDDPVSASSVIATVGSSTITVNTATEHGLVVGSPIIVQGLDSFSANGAFVVDNVPTATQFTYVCKEVQTRPGASDGTLVEIIKEETVIYIGRLYQGTQAKLDVLDSITTDGLDPSRLTVKTPHPHGFAKGTRFVLSNSVGGKTYKFDSSLINPSDFELLASPEIKAYSDIKEAYTYQDWDGEYSAKFTSYDVDVYHNTITIPNHPFNNGDQVMYIPPVDVENNGRTADESNNHTDSAMGNIGRYRTPYWVGVLDENTVTLSTSEFDHNYRSPNIRDISAMGDTNFGYHQLAKCYRIESRLNDNVIQLRKPYLENNTSEAQEVYVFSTSTGLYPPATTMSFKNYTSNDQYTPDWRKFYLKTYDGTVASTNLPTSAGPAILRFGVFGVSVPTDVITITEDTDLELLGTKSLNENTRGIATSSLSYFDTGDQVRLWRRKGETTPGGIGEGTFYYIRVLTDTTFTLHTSRVGAVNNTNRLNITSQGSFDLEMIVEKQNRFFQLYTDEALTQIHTFDNNSITGTTWIVPAKTLENRSSINDITAEGDAFAGINDGDVLNIEPLSNPFAEDVPIDPARITYTTYEDIYLYPHINLDPNNPILYPRSGRTLYYVTDGTPMRYEERPGTMIVNCQSINNTTTGRWDTISTGDEHYFTYMFKTGDRVRWEPIPSNIRFNARDVNINNSRIILWSGYGDTRNGDRVRVTQNSAISTLPGGLAKDTDYYIRRVTTNQLTLHPTEADANSNSNPIVITSRGMGEASLIHYNNLPDHIQDREDAYVRYIDANTIELYETREQAIDGTTAGRLIPSTPRGGWTRIISIPDETTGLFYAPNHFYELDQNSQTVDIATDVITTPTPHGFHTGEQLYYYATDESQEPGNTPIGGLGNQIWVYPRVIDANSFTLHTSRDNARNDTGKYNLTGTPTGTGFFTRYYGIDLPGDTNHVDLANDTITFDFPHEFETEDNITFWQRSGSIGGLGNRSQYFVRKLSDTQIALYLTRERCVADTNRINLTSASGYHNFKKVEKLPTDEIYYFNEIYREERFRIHRTRDDAIRGVMELEIRKSPDNSHTVTGESISFNGSGMVVFRPINTWCRINSVNNYGANYWNTDYNNQFKTGQQVRVVHLPQHGDVNPNFPVGSLHYIRHISNTILAFHRTYEGAMINDASDRVDIYSGSAGFYIEGTGLPVGIGTDISLVAEKPTATSLRFRENSSSGRIRRLRPTRNSLYTSYTVNRRTATETSNTFFVPSHGLVENTPLIYNSGPFSAPTSEPQLVNNTTYYVSSPTNDRFRVSTTVDTETKTITLTGSAVDQVGSFFRSDSFGFTRYVNNQGRSQEVNLSLDRVTTTVPHLFETGDKVTYYAVPEWSSPNAGTPIGGLTSENAYFVRTTSTTTFQLHETEEDALNNVNRVDFTSYGAGRGYFSRDNFITGESILLSTTSSVGGLTSGSVYYVKTMTPETIALYYTKAEAEAGVFTDTNDSSNDARAPILSFIEGTEVSFRRKNFVNFVTAAEGIQELSNVAQNAVDGVYDLDEKVGGTGSTEFTLTPTNAILSPRSLTFNPFDDFSSEFNAIRYENHKLYNGAQIRYNQSAELSIEQTADYIDDIDDQFTVPSHALTTGQAVEYIPDSGSTPVNGLLANTLYYARVIDQDTFTLHTSELGATTNTEQVNVWGITTNIIRVLESTFVDDTGNLITTTENHGLSNGDAVKFISADPPAGLTSNETYYVSVFDADQVYFHATENDAINEENPISLVTAGSGTHFLNVLDLSLDLGGVYGYGYGEGAASEDYGTAKFFAESTLTPITNLTNNTDYYVIRLSKDWFRVATSKTNAELENAINIGGDLSVDGTLGSDENHSFLTYNVGAEVVGPGTVATTLDSNVLEGTNTNFFNLFKNGDLFKVFVDQDDEENIISQEVTNVNRQIAYTQNTSTNNTTTNIITTPVHGYLTGDYVVYNAETEAGNLTPGQGYYVRLTQASPLNATQFTLHNSKQDAFDNLNIVNITSSGSGPATFTQANQFYSVDHNFEDGQTVSYTADTVMSTLVDNRLYYVGRNTTIKEWTSNSVSTNDRVTTTLNHGLVTGDAVRYNADSPAEPLQDGETYYVRIYDANEFYLHLTREDALNNANTIDIVASGVNPHYFTQTDQSNTFRLFTTYDEAIAASGSSDGEKELVATAGDANITRKYAGSVFQSKVLGVRSATGIVLEDAIPASSQDGVTPIGTQSGFQYALVTSLFVKADGFALHRPFDGGVELTPSLNPNASILRQTRKYFRYQSGKGIQVSYGINFNAPKQMDNFVVDPTTAIATITTRYPNKVTDRISIKTEGSIDNNLGVGRTFVQNSTFINGVAYTIDIGNQQSFANGEAVHYLTSGEVVPGLQKNVRYWIANNSGTEYTLHNSLSDALNGTNPVNISVPENAGDIGTLEPYNAWIGSFPVTEVVDEATFKVQLDAVPQSGAADGFSQFTPASWSGSLLRCGIFDDQNGLFFEFDGSDLYACRRSSVEQISGTVTATFNSSLIVGQDTKFLTQLVVGDKIVVRGQSYKVVHIASDTSLSIQPAYRGVTRGGVVVTKTVDTRTPQSEWNLDKGDGTGPSGFTLDTTKMQMAYIDYSWYGAGKVRFGFKALNGEVLYFHEYVHNNQFTEAYMRSGNLPARYEVLNLENPSYSPTIAHWGTSIIMDGRFDDDDAYFFTASGETISYTNEAEQQSFQGNVFTTNNTFRTDPDDGVYKPVWYFRANSFDDVRSIPNNTVIDNPTYLQEGTTTVGQPSRIGGNAAFVWIDRQPITTSPSNQTFNVGEGADPIPLTFPLVSVRLGPAVDNSLVGALGLREIINRMQLNLRNVGILTTHDVEVKLILNGNTDNLTFKTVSKPALSQIIVHEKDDTITGGVELYTFRANGASTANASIANSTVVDLLDIIELGNSIQGGDGIFPDGPDLLTISASVLDTAFITSDTPFRASGRISWTESQA